MLFLTVSNSKKANSGLGFGSIFRVSRPKSMIFYLPVKPGRVARHSWHASFLIAVLIKDI